MLSTKQLQNHLHLTLSHDNLITFIKEFNATQDHSYKIDPKGACFGISSMALQAILANKTNDFREHLLKISNHINSILALKSGILSYDIFITHLKSIYGDNKEVEVALIAFFDGIALYQNPTQYKHLFLKDHTSNQCITQQTGLSLVSNLIKPIIFEKKELKIEQLFDFLGSYTLTSLIQYLNILQKRINEDRYFAGDNSSVGFLLNGIGHTIALGYNKATHYWTIVDANNLETSFIDYTHNDLNALATEIFKAFNFSIKNNQITFFTNIFITTNIQQALKTINPSLKTIVSEDPEWKKIHNLESSTNKDSLLYAAAAHGYVQITRDLLNIKGIDINNKDNNFHTPLWIAAQNGHQTTVAILLTEKSIDVNAQDNDGITALYVASECGHIGVVKELLRSSKIQVNLRNADGYTALFIAAYLGHTEIVQELLAAGANPLIKCHDDTALDMAMRGQQDGIAKIIRNSLATHKKTIRFFKQKNVVGEKTAKSYSSLSYKK